MQGKGLSSQEEWEAEKASLQKDKELLEQKLFELENILERMSKEIESLKASLKDKQKAVSTQETEKEKLQEQERRVRKESETTIEQLQRRAQHFLRELEVKSLLCDSQCEHITLLELTNKQLLLREKAADARMGMVAVADRSTQMGLDAGVDEDVDVDVAADVDVSALVHAHHRLRQSHSALLRSVASQRHQVRLDVRYLLDHFVFKHQPDHQIAVTLKSDLVWFPSPFSFLLYPLFSPSNINFSVGASKNDVTESRTGEPSRIHVGLHL